MSEAEKRDGLQEDPIIRLRAQNHEFAARRDREQADLISQVDKYRNAYRRGKELVRGSPADWVPKRQGDPDVWWSYQSQQNRDVIMALVIDHNRLRDLAQEVVDQLSTRYDDQWATGPVLLPDLDALREALNG